jgi:hypothetical protein
MKRIIRFGPMTITLTRIHYLKISVILLLFGLLIYAFEGLNLIPWRSLTNYLPDGLWAASYASCICFIWYGNTYYLYIWSGIAIISMCLFEMFQFFGIISGTGDVLDAIIYIVFSIPIMLCGVMNSKKLKELSRNEE